MKKEEGHYTIKRVKTLPKKGNANFLYAVTADKIEKFFRWLSDGSYEEISVGGASDAATYPVENSYADNAEMFSDQGNQTLDYFQYVIDTDTYYQYLGTVSGDITDYRELTAEEVTIINNRGKKPVHKIYADAATMYANQTKQKKGYLYRTSDDDAHFEYLGTRNGDDTDYVSVGGSGGGGATAVGATGTDSIVRAGRDEANFGDTGNQAVDLSHSDGVSTTRGALADYSTVSGGQNNAVNNLSLGGTISGGVGNTITLDGVSNGNAVSIGGGKNNTIGTRVGPSAISGGDNNTIQSTGSRTSGTIGGGDNNSITAGSAGYGYSQNHTIGGGKDNSIDTDGGNGNVISGGDTNSMSNSYYGYATPLGLNTIAGGKSNSIAGPNSHNFIGGGKGNAITGSSYNGYQRNFSSILGGQSNSVVHNNAHVIGSSITTNRDNTTFVNNLSITSIPTSAAGLPSGAVWSNAGVLTIVP